MLNDDITALLVNGERYINGEYSEFMKYNATGTGKILLFPLKSVLINQVNFSGTTKLDFAKAFKTAKSMTDLSVDADGKPLDKSLGGVPRMLEEATWSDTDKGVGYTKTPATVITVITNEVFTKFALCRFYGTYYNDFYICLLDDLTLIPRKVGGVISTLIVYITSVLPSKEVATC